MKRCFSLLSVVILTVTFQSCKTNTSSYFNEVPPFHLPKIFAPNIVNTDSIELNVVFNISFTEMFFSRIVNGSFVIHHSELIDGHWAPIQAIKMYPDSVPFSIACDPTITRDEHTMYFLGVDPNNYSDDIPLAELYRIPPDIYVSEKIDGKWQLASKVDHPVSTEHFESYPMSVGDGSLYFQSDRPNGAGGRDTYRAQYLGDEKFGTPISISLNSGENASSTYVSPNEDYLIASGREGFEVSFKKNDEWLTPILIDLSYDKDWRYYCPYMSPDEKYFFFSRRYYGTPTRGWAGVTKGEVYWVDAAVIFGLRGK